MLFVPQAQPKLSWWPKKAALGRAIWVDLACKNLMKQSLVKHSQSKSHSTAVKMEADFCSSRSNSRLALAFQQVVSARHKAFIGILP